MSTYEEACSLQENAYSQREQNRTMAYAGMTQEQKDEHNFRKALQLSRGQVSVDKFNREEKARADEQDKIKIAKRDQYYADNAKYFACETLEFEAYEMTRKEKAIISQRESDLRKAIDLCEQEQLDAAIARSLGG
jgi:hypothetical protein